MVNFGIIKSFFSIRQLVKLSSQKLILPFYHTISNEPIPHISNLYQVKNIKQFESDLDYLCKYFKPIDILELKDIVYNNKKIIQPLFHLTFDDGLKELYTIIAPILERKGIPATIFINTEFVDNNALFFRYKVSLIIDKIRTDENVRNLLSNYFGNKYYHFKDLKTKLLTLNYNDISKIDEIASILNIDFEIYLQNTKPYLSKNEIQLLMNKGFTFGSHSLNHPLFKDIDLGEKKRQIDESFLYLKSELNIDIPYFSFPFSDDSVEIEFFEWLFKEANCKLSFGISGIKHDYLKYHLHRIPFEIENSKTEDIVKNEYLYYIIKSLFNKNTIKRK